MKNNGWILTHSARIKSFSVPFPERAIVKMFKTMECWLAVILTPEPTTQPILASSVLSG
jgi:hypothetical protein